MAGAGAVFGLSLFPEQLLASAMLELRHRQPVHHCPNASSPKRIIFFLQNQGFDPATCIPEGLKRSGSLAGMKLPEPTSPLEPFKDRMHIINGLHGLHTSPSHSAFFGALGGFIDQNPSQRRPLSLQTDFGSLCKTNDGLGNHDT